MNGSEHGDLLCFNLRLYHQGRKRFVLSLTQIFWGVVEDDSVG